MQDGRPLAFTSNNFQRDIWTNRYMKNKCWLLCMSWIYGILIYWGNDYRLKLITRASSIFWNNGFHLQRNKNGWPSYLDMLMRSFTRREKKMWLLMLFPRIMKKGPSFPCPSLYQIRSKPFAMNGCKTPKFLSWYNNCNNTLHLIHGILGTMKISTTMTICI